MLFHLNKSSSTSARWIDADADADAQAETNGGLLIVWFAMV